LRCKFILLRERSQRERNEVTPRKNEKSRDSEIASKRRRIKEGEKKKTGQSPANETGRATGSEREQGLGLRE